jgi:hypothetical protein
MHGVFDADGVLVGWIGYSNAVGREVFMPRRHEDIDSDRCTPGWAAFCYRVASLLMQAIGVTAPMRQHW